MPKEQRRNVSKLYNVMSLQDMHELDLNITWVEYVNKIFDGIQEVSI